jgi:hypothetical protein
MGLSRAVSACGGLGRLDRDPEAEFAAGGRADAEGVRDATPGGRDVLRAGAAESMRPVRLRSGLPGLTAKERVSVSEEVLGRVSHGRPA